MVFEFEDEKEPVLYGDVHFSFKHKGIMYDTQICRLALNTSFIPVSNSLHFTK